MKGQVTIEYILVLVIMLVILATVSMPTVEQIEADVTDTGNAVNLAAAQQKIASTATQMSLAGCGSRKLVTVHIQRDLFTPANITWDANKITGFFMRVNGTVLELKDLPYPQSVAITIPTIQPSNKEYHALNITKDCSAGASPSGCIGECKPGG